MNQPAELARVSERIEDVIIRFCRTHTEFHADDLRAEVAARCQIAPASADRVLRDLRQRGQVDYEVVSRRDSLYLVNSVSLL